MFATDKELRKGTTSRNNQSNNNIRNSSRGSSSQNHGRTTISSSSRVHENMTLSSSGSGGGGGSDNLVEQLKKERIERQYQREFNMKVIILQKIWRGKSSRKKTEISIRIECEKKLSDIENVSTILLKTKGITFVPPLNISYQLHRLILLHKYHTIQVSSDISLGSQSHRIV